MSLCLLALGVLARADEQPSEAQEQLWVEVTSLQGRPDEILVTYPSPVGRREAVRDFQDLAKWGGWTYAQPREDGPSDVIRGCATYRGRTDGVIDRSSGELPWPVLAYVFRRFGVVCTRFSAGDPFYYTGMAGRFRNEYAQVSVIAAGRQNAYGVHATMLGGVVPEPYALSRGLAEITSGSDSDAEGGGGLSPALWAVFVLCCVLLSVSAGLAISVLRRRK